MPLVNASGVPLSTRGCSRIERRPGFQRCAQPPVEVMERGAIRAGTDRAHEAPREGSARERELDYRPPKRGMPRLLPVQALGDCGPQARRVASPAVQAEQPQELRALDSSLVGVMYAAAEYGGEDVI